ncbi:hypothetical protein C8R44DRAFT_874968 [Mycena epipterygia]|nr:hypothetical protein C8R44DRAFT_874968 [Mycena epipterygia]
MSTSSPPAKRQRSDSTSITHSATWYKDGSVVLQAHDTQFRVHWSIISQHSSFFRNMQGLPQPPDQPSVEGCPIVELFDDSVVDVDHLLKALYNPISLFQTDLPLPVVAALIRLGRKYDFRELLNIAIGRLAFENPTTIQEFDARVAPNLSTPARIVYYPGILYDMITLARENDIFTVLPCAYYRAILTHDWAAVFGGVPRGDGTSATLSPIDQQTYTVGREKLLYAQFANGNTFGWIRSWNSRVGCTNPGMCNAWRNRICIIFLAAVPRFWGTLHAQRLRASLCTSCVQHAEKSLAAGRIRMWEALPSMFDLPPWSELKNDP